MSYAHELFVVFEVISTPPKLAKMYQSRLNALLALFPQRGKAECYAIEQPHISKFQVRNDRQRHKCHCHKRCIDSATHIFCHLFECKVTGIQVTENSMTVVAHEKEANFEATCHTPFELGASNIDWLQQMYDAV